MSKFLNDNDAAAATADNNDTKAIAITSVFSENSLAKN